MNKTTEALKLAEEAMIKTMSVLEQAMKLIETPLGNDEWRDGRGAWGDANKALAFIREMLAYHSYIDPIKSNVSVDKAYLRGLRAGYSLGQMESEVDLENPIQGVSSVEQRFRARVASYEKSIKEAEAAIREALDHSGDSNEMVMDWSKVKPEAIKSDPMYQMGYAAAKAEPVKQEPVAWMWVCVDVESRSIETGLLFNRGADDENTDWTPLYAEPVDTKAIRAEALEEAAKVCEAEAKGFEQAHLWDEEYAVKNCAAAIRWPKLK